MMTGFYARKFEPVAEQASLSLSFGEDPEDRIFIAPAHSRVRYSSTFRQSVHQGLSTISLY